MDKSRQQFEEWFNNEVFSLKLADKKLVNCYWDAWQASRESLINNLEPIGYINPVAQLCIKRKLNAAIKPNKEDNSIPLYRLDK
ncbi:TPA: hypothetical protein ACS8CD_003746 [Providencia alcalifaciens]